MTRPLAAVIGAGLTGLATASRLTEAGSRCVLFDKSRGVGGRMATRRAECEGATLRFDHGATHLTQTQLSEIAHLIGPASTSEPDIDPSLRKFCDAANLIPWRVGGQLEPLGWVSSSGINAVCKAVAAHLDIQLDTPISQAVWHSTERQWRLAIENAQLPASFDILIVTTPPIQAAKILAPYQGPIMSTLDKMQPKACWTLMLGTRDPMKKSALSHRGEIIDRIIAEHSKDRPHPKGLSTYTVQTTRDWSQENVEAPAEEVTQAILLELESLGWDGSAIEHRQIHRWLYAGVANPGSTPCLTDREYRLICAGDWCLGNNLDSALSSGKAAAQEALQQLS